jgi:parallel beta-helix repeat protein
MNGLKWKVTLYVLLAVVSLWTPWAPGYENRADALTGQDNLAPTRRVALYLIFVDAGDSNKIKALNGITGVVDYSGPDAATVINAALSAMRNGGELFLKAGTYHLSSPIYLPNRWNILITGEGNSTILSASGTFQGVIYFLGSSNCTVRSLTIDGGMPTYTAEGITITSSKYITVEDVKIEHCLSDAISSYQAPYIIIRSSTIVNNGGPTSPAGFGDGIGLDTSSNSTITDNIIEGNYLNGIWITSTGASVSTGDVIEGNQVNYNAAAGGNWAGITIGTTTGVVNDTIIRNNVIGNNHALGIWCLYANKLNITGNHIFNNHDEGISLSHSSDDLVQGNDLEQNGGYAGIGVDVNSKNNLITGNQLNANRNYGLAFAVMGIGVGVAATGVGVAVAMSRRCGSEVLSYGGNYYCRRHLVPVRFVNGGLWCPIEQRHLRAE